jgi:hypothetical protein
MVQCRSQADVGCLGRARRSLSAPVPPPEIIFVASLCERRHKSKPRSFASGVFYFLYPVAACRQTAAFLAAAERR